MIKHLLVPVAFLILLVSSSQAAEVLYQEIIEDTITYQVTYMLGENGMVVWEQMLPGNSDFGVPTNDLSYYHSVDGIEPPLLPGGQLRTVRLKLYLRNHSNDEIVLTVDSVDFAHLNRRHFLIGPQLSDSVYVEDSPLHSGSIHINLDNPDETFALYRSVFDAVYFPSVITDVENSDVTLPSGVSLGDNYPNPFNPSTTIEFRLPTLSHVKLSVFNVLGKQVATLVDKQLAAGEHQINWDGRDQSGQVSPSGIYFYRITADDFVGSKKMLLLK